MAQDLPQGFEAVPDGFEEVHGDNLPAGFESVPDGYEAVKGDNQDGFLSKMVKGLGGTLAAGADMAFGAVASPIEQLQALYDAGPDGSAALKQARENESQKFSQYYPSANIARLGLGDPRQNQTYQDVMAVPGLIGKGISKANTALGGNEYTDAAANLAASVLPIPGLDLLGRGAKALAARIDPGLSDAATAFQRPADLPPETPQGPISEQRTPPEPVQQPSAPYDQSMWESADDQGSLMQPTNPYDVGGHVSAAQAGNETVIGNDPQADMFSQQENAQAIPQSLIDQAHADVQADITQAYGDRGEQQSLAVPQDLQLDMFAQAPDAGITDKPYQATQVDPNTPQSTYMASARNDAINNQPEVPQQFADLANKIPGMKDIGDPDLPPEPKANEQAVTPIDQAVSNIPGLNDPKDLFNYGEKDPDKILAAAQNETDGGRVFSMYSGANMAAMLRRSSLVKGAYTIMNDAKNATHSVIMKQLVPMERTLHRLNDSGRQALSGILKDELFNKQLISDADLSAHPAPVREAYRAFRQEDMNAWQRTNEARAAVGLDPVEGKDWHVASRWSGNFKTMVHDENGRPLYMLRERTRRGLQASKEALDTKMPGLVYKDLPPSRAGDTGGFESGYTDMLSMLDKDDPRVAVLKSIYEDHMAQSGVNELGQTLHAEDKSNTRGFLGDRPQVSDSRNAKDLLRAQVDYIRNAHTWANDQEAVAQIKKLVSDPDMIEKQPNNVDYINDYTKHALGFGTNVHIKAIEDDLARKLGVDRSLAVQATNRLKGWFLAKNLGWLNPKAMAVQMIQPVMVAPALADMASHGLKVNVPDVMGKSIQDFYHYVTGSRDKMSPTAQGAIKYALDNGILSINVLEDTHKIGDSGAYNKTMQVASLNQTKAEQFGRATSYMMFVHAFENAGYKGEALYKSAEAATNRVMVDYRKFEQPMWIEKGGILGKSVGTLKNFTENNLNQLLDYSKKAVRGKPVPLMTLLGIQWAMGGMLGMYGIQDATNAYNNWIKPYLPGKWQDFNPKAHMLEHNSDMMNYGPLSKVTGINLSGSFNMGNILGGDNPLDVVAPFLTDLGRAGLSIGKAVINPSIKSAVQAAYANAPQHIKGMIENYDSDYTKNGLSLNPNTLDRGTYRRNETDRMARNFGATSLPEASFKEKAYTARQQEQAITVAKQQTLNQYLQAKTPEDRQDAVKTLQKWMGPAEIAQFLVQGKIAQATKMQQDAFQQQIPRTINNATEAMKYQRIQGMRNGGQ